MTDPAHDEPDDWGANQIVRPVMADRRREPVRHPWHISPRHRPARPAGTAHNSPDGTDQSPEPSRQRTR